MNLKIHKYDIWLQEVPGKVALTFCVAGCPNRCPGCSWGEDIDNTRGYELDMDAYELILEQYKGEADCVCFMGGEWHGSSLIFYLQLAKQYGYLTCLYAGRYDILEELYEYLDYIKLGPWIEELGGLDSPKTNQKFYKINEDKSKEDLTHLFQR